MADESTVALATALAAKGRDSKKYRMTVAGLVGVLFLFLVSAGVVFFKPDTASFLLPLAQVAIPSVGGLVAVYSGAQAAVDWKTTSSLAAK